MPPPSQLPAPPPTLTGPSPCSTAPPECPPGITPTEPDCECPDAINAKFVMAIPLAEFLPLVDSFKSQLAEALEGLEEAGQVVILSLTSGSTIAELAFVPVRRQGSFPDEVQEVIMLALLNSQVWLPEIFGLISIQVPGHDPVCTLPAVTLSEGPPAFGPEPIFSVNTSTFGLLTIMYVDVHFSRPCQGVGVLRDCGPSGCQLKLGPHVTLMAGSKESHPALHMTYAETGDADDSTVALMDGTTTHDAMEGSTGTFQVNMTIAEGICRDVLGIASTANKLSLVGNTTALGGKRENKLVVTLRYSAPPSCGHDDSAYARTAVYLGDDRVRPRLTSPVGSFSKDRRVPVTVDLLGDVVRPFNASAFTVMNGYVEDNITTSLDGTWFRVTLVIDEYATATIYLEEGALYDGLSGNPSRRSNTLSITFVPGNPLTDAITQVDAAGKAVVGLVAALSTLAGVLTSLGTLSPVGAIAANPVFPTGLLGGFGHLQTITMVGSLPMDLPDSFEKTASRWQWLRLEFLKPWGSICGKKDVDKATDGATANGTKTGNVGGGGPTQGVQDAWAWLQDGANAAPVIITRPDEGSPSASQVALMSTTCSWDIALEILFWAVILVIALLVIHKLVIHAWRSTFPEAALPELLQFPRIELYLFVFVAPPLSQAGAFLIAMRSPLGVIIGVLMLLAGPCALVGLAVFILFWRVLAGDATEYKQEDVPLPVRPAWMRPLERVWYNLFGTPIEGQWEDADQDRAILARFGPLFEHFKGLTEDMRQKRLAAYEEGRCCGRLMGCKQCVGIHLGTCYGVFDIFKRVFVAFMLGISGPVEPRGSEDNDDSGGPSQNRRAWVQVSVVFSTLVIQLVIVVRQRPFIDRFMQAAETLAVACEVQLFVIIVLILAEWGNKSRVGNALNVTMHLSILCNLLAQIYTAIVIFIGGCRVFKQRLIQARRRIPFDSLRLKGMSVLNLASSLRNYSREYLRIWTYANTLYGDNDGTKADTPVSGGVLSITGRARRVDVPMPTSECLDSQGQACLQTQQGQVKHIYSTKLRAFRASTPASCHACSATYKHKSEEEEAAMAAEHGDAAEEGALSDNAGEAVSDLYAVPLMFTERTASLQTITLEGLDVDPVPLQGYSPPSSPASPVAMSATLDARESSSCLGDAIPLPPWIQLGTDGRPSTVESEQGLVTESLVAEQVSLGEKAWASRTPGGDTAGEVLLPHDDQDVGNDQQSHPDGSVMSVDNFIMGGQEEAAGSSQRQGMMGARNHGLVSQRFHKELGTEITQTLGQGPGEVTQTSRPEGPPNEEASSRSVGADIGMEEPGTDAGGGTREKESGTASLRRLRSESSAGIYGSTLPRTRSSTARSAKLRVKLNIAEDDLLPRMPEFLDALSRQLGGKAVVNVVKVSGASPRTLSRRRGHSESFVFVSRLTSYV
eukprot:jgi/Mesvir1/21390/Mv20871-RA.1